jgi:hypothetical protein
MDTLGPRGPIEAEWERNRPSFRYLQETAMDAPHAPGRPIGPIRETMVWGDDRVHYWIVGRDGKARQGQYVLGVGTREMEDETPT